MKLVENRYHEALKNFLYDTINTIYQDDNLKGFKLSPSNRDEETYKITKDDNNGYQLVIEFQKYDFYKMLGYEGIGYSVNIYDNQIDGINERFMVIDDSCFCFANSIHLWFNSNSNSNDFVIYAFSLVGTIDNLIEKFINQSVVNREESKKIKKLEDTMDFIKK